MDIRKFKKGQASVIFTFFKTTEFDCKCNRIQCQETFIDIDHVAKLQQLRLKVGSPIIINSGFRCKSHNLAVGGAFGDRGVEALTDGRYAIVGKRGSWHLSGVATDIKFPSLSIKKANLLCEEIGFDGIGIYETFIHVDSRGSKARWEK